MTFKSNADEIRYYMKQLLNQGRECTVDEIKAYVKEKSGKDFTNGTYAGAMRDLIDRDQNYYIPRRGIYASNSTKSSNDIFTEIIKSALKSVDEACKVDVTELSMEEVKKIKERSTKIKDTLRTLLSE